MILRGRADVAAKDGKPRASGDDPDIRTAVKPADV